jgi:hypothetical protein
MAVHYAGGAIAGKSVARRRWSWERPRADPRTCVM